MKKWSKELPGICRRHWISLDCAERAAMHKVPFSIGLMLLALTCSAYGQGTVLHQDQEHLRLEMTPRDIIGNADNRPLVVPTKVVMKMTLKNGSDQRIKILVSNSLYQNRPRLYRQGRLIPYRSQILKAVKSQDDRPLFVMDPDFVFVEAYSSIELRELDLNEWYGPLTPGFYQLINRYRFTLEGPWSADSLPIEFRVDETPANAPSRN
ncbi:MAG: hypothetical protein ACXW3C_03560 [Pyrinomonadaceae bacterium]